MANGVFKLYKSAICMIKILIETPVQNQNSLVFALGLAQEIY
jgi:hypothetical protein